MKRPTPPKYHAYNEKRKSVIESYQALKRVYEKKMILWNQHVKDMYEGKLHFGSHEYEDTYTPFLLFESGVVWCADTYAHNYEVLSNLGMLTFDNGWHLDGKPLTIEKMEALITTPFPNIHY